jgi:uncharacterized Rossmann fold enzyme
VHNWKIPEEWPGETVFIVGGGPSVAHQRVHRLEGKKIIAVNSSYEAVPFASYVFFGDNRWHEEHRSRPNFVAMVKRARIVTVSAPAHGEYLKKLDRITPTTPELGLTTTRRGLSCQKTSFQGAINLAAMKGAKRIVLLGLDGQRSANGLTHHHKPHKWVTKPGNITWEAQKTQLQFIVEPLKKLGIETFNTNPDSNFTYWPHEPLESFL